MSWLKTFIFVHARPETKPDGRPLYAYRTTPNSYAELKDLVRRDILQTRRTGHSPYNLPAQFCLYAAETFRREHIEGPWSWHTVFQPIDVPEPNNITIGEWVKAGLFFWKRPVLKDNRGYMYLVTIACEGGLPLMLLQRENTNLSRFFRVILDKYYEQNRDGREAAEYLAQREAHRLPKSLRQEPVFRFAGDLISKIADLQAQIPNAADPIKALDEKLPKWRYQLPLRMDDSNAEVLLTGLVYRSNELAEERSSKIQWTSKLLQTSSGYTVEKQLSVPSTLSCELLGRLCNTDAATAPRYRLLLKTPTRTEPVAWLTRIEAASGSPRYRREWLKPKGVALTDELLLETHELILHNSAEEYPLTAGGGEPWGESPWSFVERGTSKELFWLTEGSANARDAQVWVLAPSDLVAQPNQGECETLGEIVKLNRVLYRVTGGVNFLTPLGDHFRISCSSTSDSDEHFCLSGATVVHGSQNRTIYRGLPTLRAIDSNGHFSPEIGQQRQWKPCAHHTPWQHPSSNARGRLWLRLLDHDGSERCRRRVDVVPQDFSVVINFGGGRKYGEILLQGLSGADVTVTHSDASLLEIQHEGDSSLIRCPLIPGTSLGSIEAVLKWPEAESVTLSLPYPQRGAAFRVQGRVLHNHSAVPLDRLSAIQVLVQDSAGGRRYWVTGELLGDDRTAEDYFVKRFSARLPHLNDGRLEISLWQWQARIESLLSSTPDLDARVVLKIETGVGEMLARMNVTRFDCALRPDRESGTVSIPESQHERLGQGWSTRIRCEILPLWRPSTEPIALEQVGDQTGCWKIPENLESGPWWVLAYDGDWARFRPLLWTLWSEDDTSDEVAPPCELSLESIIRNPDESSRADNLNSLLSDLPYKLESNDWPLLFEYFRLSHQFPPSAISVLQEIARYPKTLAMALINADEETFETVWDLSRNMPFLWILIPVNDWLEVTQLHRSYLYEALESLEEATRNTIAFQQFEVFRARTTAKREYWSVLCDWIQEQVYPNQPLPGQSLLPALRNGSDNFLDEIARPHLDSLQSRHEPDERWPESKAVFPAVKQLEPWMPSCIKPEPGYSLPLRYAPFLASHISLHSIPAETKLTYEMRILRSFDREWFDFAYSLGLAVGLARWKD